MFTEEKNTHKTNKRLLAQLGLAILGSCLCTMTSPRLAEALSLPGRLFLWSIYSHHHRYLGLEPSYNLQTRAGIRLEHTLTGYGNLLGQIWTNVTLGWHLGLVEI